MKDIYSIDKMHLPFTKCGGYGVTENSVRDTSKHILEHTFKFAFFLYTGKLTIYGNSCLRVCVEQLCSLIKETKDISRQSETQINAFKDI